MKQTSLGRISKKDGIVSLSIIAILLATIMIIGLSSAFGINAKPKPGWFIMAAACILAFLWVMYDCFLKDNDRHLLPGLFSSFLGMALGIQIGVMGYFEKVAARMPVFILLGIVVLMRSVTTFSRILAKADWDENAKKEE
jgi:hypothetical protein